MSEPFFNFQQGSISTPFYNHQGLSVYQDPFYSNPYNSSQLPVPVIDTFVQAINATKVFLSELSGNSQKDYIMGTAFGFYNQESANPILTDWAQNNFTGTPHIELVFGQNFNGAYAKDGRVASLTALDPAYPASDYDIDGSQVGYQGAKNFNEVANKSIALVVSDEDGGWAGDNRRAATANYSFLVRYTNYSGEKDSFYHGSVVTVFRKLLERQFLPSSFAMNRFGDSADFGYSHEGYFTAQWSNGDWQPNWFTKENGSNRISSWV